MKYRYREPHEMKDSGVEWLGMIPKEWEVSKYKYNCSIYNGNSLNDELKKEFESENEEEIPYISSKDIDGNTLKIIYNNGLRIPQERKEYKIAPKNSSLICIEGGSAGKKIAFTEEKVCFVNKLACIHTKKNNSFIHYTLKGNIFKSQFNLSLSGLIGGVSIAQIKNFNYIEPTNQEQEKIATFLDQKIAEFDNIIAKKQAFIDKLTEAKKSLISEVVTGKKKITIDNGKLIMENRKAEDMKDSGVEWLGMIPKEWGVSSLKYYTNIQNGQVNPTLFPYSDMPHIGPENIEKFTGKLLNYNLAKEDGLISGKYLFKKNDVLYGKINPQLGKVTLAKFEGICSADMYAIKVGKKLIANFLFYFMLSNSFFHQSTTFPARAGIPKINREEINSIYIEIPSLEEQKLIVDFLDEKTAKIDNTIERIKVQIEKLKEAKQSLISEAVTGKIEVM